MGPILISIQPGGRVGNHLYSLAWMIESSMRTGGGMLAPSFDAYRVDFEGPARHRIARWPVDGPMPAGAAAFATLMRIGGMKLYQHLRVRYQWRLDEARPALRKVPGLRNRAGYVAFDWLVHGRHAVKKLGPTFQIEGGFPDHHGPATIAYLRSRNVVLVDSAVIEPRLLMPEVVAELRRYLKPADAHAHKALAWVRAQRDGTDRLVSVAIRQGDFKTWAGGAGFVAPAAFRTLLAGVAEQFATRGQRCRFLLCSDEALNPADFAGLDIRLVPGGPMRHFCVLGACDLFLGTAGSTFGHWASLIGGCPWFPVQPGNIRVPRLEEFGVFGVDRCG